MTFAIGDIHGCFDELLTLLAVCDLACAEEDARFVFVGDYVDRGPDSRRVVQFLMRRQSDQERRFICLRGNHEEMLIRAASRDRSDRDLMNWWGNGGERTLESYGVDDACDLPAEHLAWLRQLPLMHSDRHRLFAHAGIRPGVPLSLQSQEDLLWIREPFLSSADDHGPLVVHGHTPLASGRPDLRANRLNLDTGVCFGGPLSAAAFSSRRRRPVMFATSMGDIVRL
ncbi:serine/threonine protein phosphatase 1 [Bradyrhizobium japonicum]|uniref:metallophosphoesterase family protein n=1 Tax=Bradyrhizobium japonicum TaxID=375 RepID=UPI0022279338|nr:metallophosphoesterase family protein [Bradyrhizobium japonicum]MCW2221544.1 serine/threonine protein phosphatase 1 [Bradyrhizobium japonicum]MCW2346156.1 serine/threonine protein phosphatase 1 [Bradyrhizobium japonicum]